MSTNFCTYPIAKIARGGTYYILKQTEDINLYFHTELHGLSIAVKSGLKGNKFAGE